MKSDIRHVCLLLLLALVYPCSLAAQAKPAKKAEPDMLIFINGDQLTGKLVRGVGPSIIFKSDIIGEVTVPLAKVKELRSSTTFAILPKQATSHPGNVPIGQVTAANGAITVTPTNGSDPVTAPLASVGYIVDRTTYDQEVLAKRSFFSGWNGAITGGATLQQATQYGHTYNVTVGLFRTIPTVTYFNPRTRTVFNLAETYGILSTPVTPQTNPVSPDSVVKTNVFHADAERDRYLNRKIYLFAGTSFDHNFSQGLDLQQDYGLGVGWTPINNAIHELDLKTDVHYQKQEFQTPESNQNLIGSAFTENYRRILPLKISLLQVAAFNPAWNNTRAYSSSGSVTLILPVIKRFAVSFTGTDSFINNPAVGFKKNSLQFTTGITYNLR